MPRSVSRRSVLTLLVGGLLAVNPWSRSIAHADAPTQRQIHDSSIRSAFYVAATGDDSADGLTESTAWATIQHLNSSLPDNAVVLFRRGDTFYGEFTPPLGCEIGAYGTGSSPVLTMFKLLNLPSGWKQHAKDVWRIDLRLPETHEGYTETNDANIGFLIVDGSICASLKFTLDELASPWDFYCDVGAHTLYVKSPQIPTSVAKDIRAAPSGNSHGASGAVIFCKRGENDIHDIHIMGAGGCGIRGTGSDVNIHDCEIELIGGSWLAGHGNGHSRYGNGIEVWTNVSNWTIERCEVSHIYDAAWSPQGRDDAGGPVCWANLTVRNNYMHDCGQMIEIWSQSDNPQSQGFVRVVVEGNRFERAGYGAFSDVRPNQAVRTHLLTYDLQTPVDVIIQDNVFDDCYGAYSFHSVEPPAGYVTRNNVIKLRGGHLIEFQRKETIEEAALWLAATGREIGSTFIDL